MARIEEGKKNPEKEKQIAIKNEKENKKIKKFSTMTRSEKDALLEFLLKEHGYIE